MFNPSRITDVLEMTIGASHSGLLPEERQDLIGLVAWAYAQGYQDAQLLTVLKSKTQTKDFETETFTVEATADEDTE